MAHRIRLGSPWEVTAEVGRTRWVRRFGRPRTLDAQDRVWLVCDSLPPETEVIVNDAILAAAVGGLFAADITPLLEPRNQIVLFTSSAVPTVEAALEIRADPLISEGAAKAI
jgi:hypothetical protein